MNSLFSRLTKQLTTLTNRFAFNWTMRESLYQHLSDQMKNGLSIDQALSNFCKSLQRRNKPSSLNIVRGIARLMRNGSTLTQALKPWVTSTESGLISSGEKSGSLPSSFDLIIASHQRMLRVKRSLKGAIRRPIILGIVVYAMLWAIGTYMAPTFQLILPAEKAQGLPSLLYMLGDLAQSAYLILIPIVSCLIYLAVRCALPRWVGQHRIVAERFFPFSFYRDMEGYAWLMSFSTLLRAGMPDVNVLKFQLETANPWLTERLHSLRSRMMNGLSLHEALLKKDKAHPRPFGFPNPDVIEYIASLSGGMHFPERIGNIADQWAQELERKTRQHAEQVGFWMDLAIYAVVTVLVLSMNAISIQLSTIPGLI